MGYNVIGFRDLDYSVVRSTAQGRFTAVKVKFDADTFSFLGLGR